MTYRTFDDDEAMLRVWDVEDIKNLIHRSVYYEAANRRVEALNELWVSLPENMKTASYGRNWGFHMGMEHIKAYYVGRNRFGACGTQTIHPLSTKLLCLAEDGQTAQGLWMGIGYDTAPNQDGVLEGKWINERIAVDFIWESDGWKIWHMFVGTNYVIEAGGTYMTQPVRTETREYRHGNPAWYMVGKGKTEEKAEIALFDQIPDYPEREAFGTPDISAEVYTALYNENMAFPPLPEEYRTFAEVISYSADGFAKTFSAGRGRVE